MDAAQQIVQTLSETDLLILLVMVIFASLAVSGGVAWGVLQYAQESARARHTMSKALVQQAAIQGSMRELLEDVRQDARTQLELERRQLTLLERHDRHLHRVYSRAEAERDHTRSELASIRATLDPTINHPGA